MSLVTTVEEECLQFLTNVDKDVVARTDAGKRFQVLGVATLKARSPKVDLHVVVVC